jgi:branched-chain amino acid transport system substrate-binding protein
MTKKTVTSIILGVLFAALVLVILFGFVFTGKTVEQKTIKIGFIGPMTGDLASYGQSLKNSVEMATNEINNNGGINGKKLEVIYEDADCGGPEALTAAQKLIEINQIKVILGSDCSGSFLSEAPLANEKKVIIFSSFASSPDITIAGDYVFRNMISDIQSGKDAADMIPKKKIAILTENTDYALALEKVFKNRILETGKEIVLREVYNQNEKDYRTQILKIKEKNPEAIFINAQSGVSGGLAAKQIREYGITVPIYSATIFSGADALETAGSAAEGIVFVDAPGLSKTNSKAVEFLERYNSFYGEPANEYLVGASYDRVYILSQALKKCSENTECIKNYLYSTSYSGTIGNYKFDENGDVVGLSYILKKVVNGKPIEL